MLTLNVTEEQAKAMYVIDRPTEEKNQNEESETTIPLVTEKLEPAKTEVIEEANIIKKPVKETKQVEMNLTHEELIIERRPLDEPRPIDEDPVDSTTVIKIPLKREEVEINKQSYITEEIVAKKKPVTETRTISEQVTSEKLEEPDNAGL
jgi:uncharacterized protein (TIGR02271 family)